VYSENGHDSLTVLYVSDLYFKVTINAWFRALCDLGGTGGERLLQ
jgi:hypothetical protein